MVALRAWVRWRKEEGEKYWLSLVRRDGEERDRNELLRSLPRHVWRESSRLELRVQRSRIDEDLLLSSPAVGNARGIDVKDVFSGCPSTFLVLLDAVVSLVSAKKNMFS